MPKKFLFGLLPVLAAAAVALGLGASSAGAVACNGAGARVLCNGNNEGLRDNNTEPPETNFPGFGANILAVNTNGALRLSVGALFNENPINYAFFGLQIDKNNLSLSTKCEEARGYVEFVDIQNAKNQVPEPSPVYSNTSPGFNSAWQFSIFSNLSICGTKAGTVVIEKVSLYFPKLNGGTVVTGTITGKYVQPALAGKCPGGGIELNEKQPALIVNGTTTEGKLTGGAEGKAFICFVSSNNNLYPETAPKWEKFKDEAKSEIPGIWKD